jgi:hypothetical protein
MKHLSTTLRKKTYNKKQENNKEKNEKTQEEHSHGKMVKHEVVEGACDVMTT